MGEECRTKGTRGQLRSKGYNHDKPGRTDNGEDKAGQEGGQPCQAMTAGTREGEYKARGQRGEGGQQRLGQARAQSQRNTGARHIATYRNWQCIRLVTCQSYWCHNNPAAVRAVRSSFGTSCVDLMARGLPWQGAARGKHYCAGCGAEVPRQKFICISAHMLAKRIPSMPILRGWTRW